MSSSRSDSYTSLESLHDEADDLVAISNQLQTTGSRLLRRISTPPRVLSNLRLAAQIQQKGVARIPIVSKYYDADKGSYQLQVCQFPEEYLIGLRKLETIKDGRKISKVRAFDQVIFTGFDQYPMANLDKTHLNAMFDLIANANILNVSFDFTNVSDPLVEVFYTLMNMYFHPTDNKLSLEIIASDRDKHSIKEWSHKFNWLITKRRSAPAVIKKSLLVSKPEVLRNQSLPMPGELSSTSPDACFAPITRHSLTQTVCIHAKAYVLSRNDVDERLSAISIEASLDHDVPVECSFSVFLNAMKSMNCHHAILENLVACDFENLSTSHVLKLFELLAEAKMTHLTLNFTGVQHNDILRFEALLKTAISMSDTFPTFSFAASNVAYLDHLYYEDLFNQMTNEQDHLSTTSEELFVADSSDEEVECHVRDKDLSSTRQISHGLTVAISNEPFFAGTDRIVARICGFNNPERPVNQISGEQIHALMDELSSYNLNEIILNLLDLSDKEVRIIHLLLSGSVSPDSHLPAIKCQTNIQRPSCEWNKEFMRLTQTSVRTESRSFRV